MGKTSSRNVQSATVRLGLIFLFVAIQVQSTKRRRWLGPDRFQEGLPPPERYRHGFAASNDGLLTFGGWGAIGEDMNEFQSLRPICSRLFLTQIPQFHWQDVR
jgi:hypothetical protein